MFFYKYTCSFTHIVVEASSVCMEDGQNDVSKVRLCVVIFETTSVRTKGHVALHTSDNYLTPLAEHTRHRAFGSFRPGQCLL